MARNVRIPACQFAVRSVGSFDEFAEHLYASWPLHVTEIIVRYPVVQASREGASLG